MEKRVYSTVKGNQPYCWLPQKPRVYKGSEVFVTKVTKKYINLLFLNRLIYKCIISVNLSYLVTWLPGYTFLSLIISNKTSTLTFEAEVDVAFFIDMFCCVAPWTVGVNEASLQFMP